MLAYLFQRSLEGDALEWYYTLSIHDVQDFARVRDHLFEKYSHRVGYVPSLTDLIVEKMRSDEDFTQFADRWRLLATKMLIPIPEVEQINLIVNNSNPYLRTWLSLTDMPITFAELYSRGQSIQIQLRDPSFQLYLPRLKKKDPIPTTEGTTSNE